MILCVLLAEENSDIENTIDSSANLDYEGQWVFWELLDKFFFDLL